MKYLSSFEISKIWNVSERTVRNYCEKGRVVGAILEGKTWKIPNNANKPAREGRHVVKKEKLLSVLRREKESKLPGGIYHRLQIDMAYNSNHIEGSTLTHDQTKYIFESKNLKIDEKWINVNLNDLIETANHFRCIDLVIDSAKSKLTESLIKQLHFILKGGTSDARETWFKVGDYKILDNEVGGMETTPAKEVTKAMKELLDEYNKKKDIRLEDIIDFHAKFEKIHPFQDGNGRVGRLIMLKECLKHNIVPILIKDEYKQYYYRGLREYNNEKGFLIDTCLSSQDEMKKCLDKFHIAY